MRRSVLLEAFTYVSAHLLLVFLGTQITEHSSMLPLLAVFPLVIALALHVSLLEWTANRAERRFDELNSVLIDFLEASQETYDPDETDETEGY